MNGVVVGTTGSTAPTAGGTTATGSTGTTGTTGTTTGSDPIGTTLPVGDLLRIEEWRSAPSTRVSANEAVHDTGRHILRLKLKFTCDGYTGPDNKGRNVVSSKRVVAVAVTSPGELGRFPMTEGGTNDAYPVAGTPSTAIGSPGSIYNMTNKVVLHAPPGVYVDGRTYWNAYPSLGSAGTLSSGTLTIRIFIRTISMSWYDNGTPNDTSSMTDTMEEVESVLDVQKLMCEAVSTDSRKAFGQPNLEGALPGDANAEFDHISFKDWVYKGGAFVGNMPTGSGDLSGEGRLQVRYVGSTPNTPYVGSCLTAFATSRRMTAGTAGNPASPAVIGLYRPNSYDLNLNLGDQVRWGTKWGIQPQTTPTNPIDYSKNAYQFFTLTDAMQGQYANWQMPYRPTGPNPPPTEIWNRLALALPELGGPTWQSFSTTQYQNIPGAQFPINDSAVRIWRVGQVTTP